MLVIGAPYWVGSPGSLPDARSMLPAQPRDFKVFVPLFCRLTGENRIATLPRQRAIQSPFPNGACGSSGVAEYGMEKRRED